MCEWKCIYSKVWSSFFSLPSTHYSLGFFFFLYILSYRPFLFCSPALNVERRRTETFVRLSNAELKFRACLMTSWHPASSVDAEHGQNHNPRRTIRIDRTARGDETKLGNEMKQTMLYLLGVWSPRLASHQQPRMSLNVLFPRFVTQIIVSMFCSAASSSSSFLLFRPTGKWETIPVTNCLPKPFRLLSESELFDDA